jgi:hypothetical protein
MKTKEIQRIVRELIEAYDKYRTAWIGKHGTDGGFNEWFTTQVEGGKV